MELAHCATMKGAGATALAPLAVRLPATAQSEPDAKIRTLDAASGEHRAHAAGLIGGDFEIESKLEASGTSSTRILIRREGVSP
jgi:hypothetical protein